MTKPSEMSGEEGWNAAIHTVLNLLHSMKSFTAAYEFLGRCDLRFPADPVERVSDEKLEQFTTPVFNNTAMQLMALELIERRARDKEQKG